MKSTLLFSSLLTLSAVGLPTERVTTRRHGYPGPVVPKEVDVGFVTDGRFAFDGELIKAVMSKVKNFLTVSDIQFTVEEMNEDGAREMIESHEDDEEKKMIIFGNVQKLENDPKLNNVKLLLGEDVYAHQYSVVGYVNDHVNQRVVVILPKSPDIPHDPYDMVYDLVGYLVAQIRDLWETSAMEVSSYGEFSFAGFQVMALRPVHPTYFDPPESEEDDYRAPSPPIHHRNREAHEYHQPIPKRPGEKFAIPPFAIPPAEDASGEANDGTGKTGGMEPDSM